MAFQHFGVCSFYVRFWVLRKVSNGDDPELPRGENDRVSAVRKDMFNDGVTNKPEKHNNNVIAEKNLSCEIQNDVAVTGEII